MIRAQMIDMETRDGRTCAEIAAQHKFADIIQELAQRGATDPCAESVHRVSALTAHCVCRRSTRFWRVKMPRYIAFIILVALMGPFMLAALLVSLSTLCNRVFQFAQRRSVCWCSSRWASCRSSCAASSSARTGGSQP